MDKMSFVHVVHYVVHLLFQWLLCVFCYVFSTCPGTTDAN